jgi:hypothetical protein
MQERTLLMLHLQQGRCVVHRTIAVIVIANSAIEKMILQNAVKGIQLCIPRSSRFRENSGVSIDLGSAGARQSAVYFDQTGIARLYRTKLGMIANVRNVPSAHLDHID